MHRSGTSLLGGLLLRLGLALPGETIAADQHNPEGYFEWDEVVAIQERLLTDLDRWWPSEQGVLALPEGWLGHPAVISAARRLRALLAVESARQQRLWAIKDPRCSRLLPLWIQLAAELDLPLQLLLAVRDPAEVTASLLHRDGPLVGMDANRAQQLWWRHNLEVVRDGQAANLSLAVIDFGRWFVEPEAQLELLLSALPSLQPTPAQRQSALDLIRPEHRRSGSAAQKLSIRPELRRLHQRLLRTPLPRRWPTLEPPRALRRQANSQLPDQDWLQDPSRWKEWLELHRHYPAARCSVLPSLGGTLKLNCCGASWSELFPHLLTQRLPLSDWGQFTPNSEESHAHELVLERRYPEPQGDRDALERLCINLELPALDRAEHWLSHLRTQQLIWDPDPARVLLLRALGLPAWWLDGQQPPNDWLQLPSAHGVDCWGEQLGLSMPTPEALVVLGPAGRAWDHACAQEALQQPLHHSGLVAIDYLPGWPELIIENAQAGWARAGWLQAAARVASRLVVADAVALPAEWALLADLKSEPKAIQGPTSPSDLRAIHQGHPLMVLAEERPAQPSSILFQWASGTPVKASVLVSLFNYEGRITEALESVAAQRIDDLELIVVDDASRDGGAAVVVAWMEAQLRQDSHPFARVLLLQHSQNAGLAAARNSGFAAAKAVWCFVLDADNALSPDAVVGCLELAERGSEHLAVVHPLLAVEAEPGRPDEQRSLVRPQSWQRERFRFENHVDAMALVRRSSWESVGGYTHIEGGWEDYDFWCKLVEAGFYGVQSPRVLATYRSHADSMSHTATNHSWRALSRTLQERHSWLKLPLAES